MLPVNLEHPVITKIRRYGYPEPEKVSNSSRDYFGDEILPGDAVVKFDDEIILEENLRRYLTEVWGAEFTVI